MPGSFFQSTSINLDFGQRLSAPSFLPTFLVSCPFFSFRRRRRRQGADGGLSFLHVENARARQTFSAAWDPDGA